MSTISNPFATAPAHTSVRAITHAGIFHADDVTALAILVLAFGKVECTRTRDRDELSEATADKSVFVLDVGGKYDSSSRNYDHHQRQGELPPARPNGVPQAAAGMTWAAVGKQAIAATVPGIEGVDFGAMSDYILEQIDVTLQGIDALDCGYSKPKPEVDKPVQWSRCTLSFLVSQANPIGLFGEDDLDQHFEEAVQMVIPVLRRMILSYANDFALQAHVTERIQEAVENDLPYFVLDHGMPAPVWANIAAKAPESILYAIIVMPGTGRGVQQVPVKPDSFQGRKPLPEAWAGARAQELADIIGVQDDEFAQGVVFCHPGRFIAGHRTLSGAIKMASIAANA